MKKIYLLLGMLFSGTLAMAQATCGTTVSTFPYFQNFESGAGGWTASASGSWALGTPAKSVIIGASSGTNAWVTGLTGMYAASEQSEVASPCFNFTGVIAPIIEMKIWWNSEFSWDGAVLQSSVDNGVTWQVVGAFGDPNNWYNDNTVNGAPGGQTASSAVAWTGRNSSSNGSGGYVLAKHVLTGLGNLPNVRLRIAFGADASIQDDGFAFDDVRIYDTPANDAGIASITNPVGSVLPNVSTPVTVTVKNYGTSALTSATLGFSVNGTTIVNNYAFTGNVPLNGVSAPVTIGNHSFPAGTYTLKTWSRLPNGALDGNNGNDTTTVTIYSCNTLAGTYTINKILPASATNFQSLTSAAQALMNCGVSGPVTFNVATGTGPYNEQVVLGAVTGASATNTITFNGAGNTLSANPTGTNLGVITLDGADYVKFDNFILTLDAAATSGWGVQIMNEANYNTISNSTINLPHSSTSSNVNGMAWGLNSSFAAGNHGSNNKIQNNTINGGYYGIRVNGNTGATGAMNNEITGNNITDSYIYSVYLSNTDGTLFQGNDISRPTRSNVSSFYGTYLTSVNKNTVINKNRYHNGFGGVTASTGTAYVIYFSSTDAPAGSENIVKNNLIYDINTTGTIYAIYSIGSDGVYHFHNTIDLVHPGSTGTVRGFYQTTAATNVKFQNNIITIDGGVSGTKNAMYFGTTTSAISSNRNVLYATNGAHVGYYSANKTTLADWQTSSSQDANSVSADPMYVNRATGNFKPINSTVNNIGAPVIPAVSDDITGASRNVSTPDPGAYEFTPAANDAGITAIISPTSPVQPGVSQPIQVTIKNYGLSPLTTATITATITGTTNQTITYNWTGNLANNATANATIGNYSFLNGSYSINVCTSLPNGATDPNPGNDCFATSIISCTALSGPYTINKNNPTAGTNFASLTDAAQRISNCGVSGPVTFNVVAGTGPYNEQLVLNTISGVSATNTVTFEGNGNTISVAPTATAGIVTLNGADYVKVNNFILTLDAAATSGWGVQIMNEANYNTISNSTINLPLTNTSSNVNGIVWGLTAFTAGNNGSNNKIQNNTINGGYYAIRVNGNTGTTGAVNNEITGNTIKDNYIYNIYLSETDGTLIQGNDFSRPTRTTVSSFYGVYATGVNKSMNVNKNRFHNAFGGNANSTGSAYVFYFSSSDAPTGSENIIKNNLIYDINTNGTIYAIYNIGSDGVHYLHNTIDLTNPNNTGTVRGFYQTTSATNIKLQNNIFTIVGGTGTKTGLYFGTAASTIISNYNDIYVPAGDVGYYGGAFPTLVNWKTANTNAYDQNSVSIDPIYSSPATGDLTPTSVGVNNIGTPLANVTDDILGNPRSTTAPDLGAYEFTLNPNDVGVSLVAGPASGCGLTATETITVTLKNYGTTTQTSIPVKLFLNGNDLTPTPEVWTGSLAPNATATHTFTAKANLATAGFYTIVGRTALGGDSNNGNNSDTLTVTNALMAGLPVLNFETPATGLNAVRVLTNSKSAVTENAAASRPLATNPATSTKGMLMEGTTAAGWLMPVGITDPWLNNPDHFSAVYMCFSATGGPAGAPLWLSFDLKQTFKTASANTNFRVTINGTAVGGNTTGAPANTYRPPFAGTGGTTDWTKIYIDLSAYKNQLVEIGFESSVAEPFANGAGTANLVDNIRVQWANPTGVKENALAASLSVYPNPSEGVFAVSVPSAKTYTLEVTDLTGKVITTQQAKGNTQLNLQSQAKGVYLLKVTSEGNTAIQKLIIQ